MRPTHLVDLKADRVPNNSVRIFKAENTKQQLDNADRTLEQTKHNDMVARNSLEMSVAIMDETLREERTIDVVKCMEKMVSDLITIEEQRLSYTILPADSRTREQLVKMQNDIKRNHGGYFDSSTWFNKDENDSIDPLDEDLIKELEEISMSLASLTPTQSREWSKTMSKEIASKELPEKIVTPPCPSKRSTRADIKTNKTPKRVERSKSFGKKKSLSKECASREYPSKEPHNTKDPEQSPIPKVEKKRQRLGKVWDILTAKKKAKASGGKDKGATPNKNFEKRKKSIPSTPNTPNTPVTPVSLRKTNSVEDEHSTKQ